MTHLLRVQNFGVSSDGFGAGEGQSLEHPFGHANPMDLVGWCFATASWVNRGEPGGTRGLDDYFTRDYDRNIGAEIMGRNKFRSAARSVAGRRLARLVGRGAAVSHTGVRADALPT